MFPVPPERKRNKIPPKNKTKQNAFSNEKNFPLEFATSSSETKAKRTTAQNKRYATPQCTPPLSPPSRPQLLNTPACATCVLTNQNSSQLVCVCSVLPLHYGDTRHTSDTHSCWRQYIIIDRHISGTAEGVGVGGGWRGEVEEKMKGWRSRGRKTAVCMSVMPFITVRPRAGKLVAIY